MKELVEKLEMIFTIDGRGRPEKCKMFLELLQDVDINIIKVELKRMAERKFI